MGKQRSPQYPSIGLGEAIEKIRKVYEADMQTKLPREVVAKHAGYNSLNGKALGVLSTLGKYGLLDGRADETHVSDLALDIIAHPVGSAERVAAIKHAASNPALFSEIAQDFPQGASDAALKSWLMKKKFLPNKIDDVIRIYRETLKVVDQETSGYDSKGQQQEKNGPGNDEISVGDLVNWESGNQIQWKTPWKVTAINEDDKGELYLQVEGDGDYAGQTGWIPMSEAITPDDAKPVCDRFTPPPPPPKFTHEPQEGMREDKASLDEGEVTLHWPESLSQESVKDFEYWVNGIIRRAKRRAGMPEDSGKDKSDKAD